MKNLTINLSVVAILLAGIVLTAVVVFMFPPMLMYLDQLKSWEITAGLFGFIVLAAGLIFFTLLFTKTESLTGKIVKYLGIVLIPFLFISRMPQIIAMLVQ